MINRFLVYYVLPRPLARIFVAALTFLGMLIKKQLLGARNVQISIPSGCDHNCQFCITDIHGAGSPKNRRTLSFDELCSLVDSALSICSLNLNIVSAGEPVLYPRLPELIDYIWRKSRGRANIKIVTNGTSLTRFSPDFFAKRNVFLWLSLHSGDEKVWNTIHRPLVDSREKFKNLKSWLIEYNKLTKERVTLHNVISVLNADHLTSVLTYAWETNSKNVFFGRLYGFPHLQLNGEQEVSVLRTLENLSGQFSKAGIKNNIHTFKYVAISHDKQGDEAAEPLEKKPLKSTDFYKHNNCYISWLFSSVDDSGNVLPCGGGTPVGNIRERTYAGTLASCSPNFIAETTSIKMRGTNVEGCRCQECPHIQMNTEANRYLNLLTLTKVKDHA